MDQRNKWIANQVRLGWLFLGGGLVVGLMGILLERQAAPGPFNSRLLTGLGILLLGIGAGYLVRYRAALKDSAAARRLVAEERDERSLLIRAQAGNRAYWISAGLFYLGLMWASFAANGSLPALGGDVLWYFLAAGVLLPFGVYLASVLSDERNR